MHQLRSLALQESVHFRSILPINLDLGEDRVLHIDIVVFDVGEDVLIGEGFFLVELVARKGQDLEALVFVLGVEFGKAIEIHGSVVV